MASPTTATANSDERIVYVNGAFLEESKAKISIFDRGFLFGEGIYEVTAVLNSKLMDADLHMERLRRSCNELDNMSCPWSDEEILGVHRELIKVNSVKEGSVYLQVTRGSTGDRNFHAFDPSSSDSQPTLVIFTQSKLIRDNPKALSGMSVITLPDLRWGRRDIKTTQLVAATMAKSQAKLMGADDAWFVDDDGFITEGSSANVFWINKRTGTVVTRALSTQLLPGITRRTVLDRCLSKLGLEIEERKFRVEEVLMDGKEAFVTSSTNFIMPVVSIDEKPVGSGAPGSLVQQLRQHYVALSEEATK